MMSVLSDLLRVSAALDQGGLPGRLAHRPPVGLLAIGVVELGSRRAIIGRPWPGPVTALPSGTLARVAPLLIDTHGLRAEHGDEQAKETRLRPPHRWRFTQATRCVLCYTLDLMTRTLIRRGSKLVVYVVLAGLSVFGVVFSALNYPWFLVAAGVVAALLLASSGRRRRNKRRARLQARRLGNIVR